MTANSNAAAVSKFVSGLHDVILPPEVTIAAKQSLIDWFAACLIATSDAQSRIVADVIQALDSRGYATAVDGRTGSAAPIALINGTYSHSTEYDDFHNSAVLHIGGATFAAALALGMDRGFTGKDVLRAFVTGFEVSAHFGMNGTGLALGNAGWHATCLLAHLSSAVACASLLHLDRIEIEQACGFAAAQMSGMQSSAGTIAKPFQIGKAAFAGVLAANLAERGATGPQHFLEGPNGVFSILLQKEVTPKLDRLGKDWEILRNTFKPYAACQCTHASIDAAKGAKARINPEAITSVLAYVNPFALKIAGKENPETPLQCRFSLKHVIAMTLLGYGVSPADFTPERVHELRIARLREMIQIIPTEQSSRTSATLEITTADGAITKENVPAGLGSIDRPMSFADTERKFVECATDALGAKTQLMLEALRRFEDQGALSEVAGLLKGNAKRDVGGHITAA